MEMFKLNIKIRIAKMEIKLIELVEKELLLIYHFLLRRINVPYIERGAKFSKLI